MDFYKDIAQRLYTGNTNINGTYFSDSFEFIEAIHKQAEFKGKVFYQNLIHAMPTGEGFADTQKGETPSFRENVFLEISMYCKEKIEEIEELEFAGNPSHVFYNFDNLMEVYHDAISPANTYSVTDGVRTNLFSFYLKNEFKDENSADASTAFFFKHNSKVELAKREINNLIYANNNNTEFLVKRIIREYHFLIKQFENFDKKYESFKIENKPILHRYTQAKNSFYGFFRQYLDVFKKYDSDNLLGLSEEIKTEKGIKLKWLGNQKQLAELFITLEKLNWFEPIQDGERKSIARNICNLFDITKTQRNPNTDLVNSFAEILKPDTDTSSKTETKTYPKVFTPRYISSFSKIEKRS